MSKSKYDFLLVSPGDIDQELVDAFDKAHNDSPFKAVELDREKALAMMQAFDYYGTEGRNILMAALLDEKVVGLVAASEHPYFKDVGQEIIWWVDKDHRNSKLGLELIGFIEEWSAHRKHKYLFMAHFHNEMKEPLTKMFTRKGYTPVEYSYMKEIK